jgi:hypothetical protein
VSSNLSTVRSHSAPTFSITTPTSPAHVADVPEETHNFDITAISKGVDVATSIALYPGARNNLVVNVVNSKTEDMNVTSVGVIVGDASATCPASNLFVSSFAGSLRVPAGGTATALLNVSMNPDAPDGCKDVSFPLTLKGAAMKAEQK